VHGWGALQGNFCGQRRGCEGGRGGRWTRGPGMLAAVVGDASFRIPGWAQEGVKLVEVAMALGALAFGGTTCVRRWLLVNAGAKFRARAPLYLTIPLISGLLNWATNQLAVWMIFNPLEFVGKNF
jgi:hypothetical protein